MIRKSASAGRIPKMVRDTASLRLSSFLSDTRSADLLERRGVGGVGGGVYGVHMGRPDAALNVLQSIESIR